MDDLHQVPFDRVDLILKQVLVDTLSPDERVILDFFAGGFADPPGDPPPIERDAPIALMEQAGFTIHVDRSIQRRFAGDATLPRSRYFTVCHTADGNDGGTLVNELTAYGQPLRSGPVDIIDTSVPSPEADHLRRYLRPGTAAVFFLGYTVWRRE